MILGATSFWMLLFYVIYRIAQKYKPLKGVAKYISIENQVILGAHLLDAAGTFTAMSFFGYGEQHVVPNILIPLLGPQAMFILKIAVVLPVLWAIDRWGEKGEFNNFLKIVILILGLAPALRNLLRLLCMV
jgi:uncharacterized membrane protein